MNDVPASAMDFTPVPVWGVPFAPFTMARTLQQFDHLIAAGKPQYVITANLNYVMLTDKDARLQKINSEAAFILADGKPIVIASKRQKHPLPERVAGADLIPALCTHAAQKGYKLYFLGGAPGTADKAASELTAKYPGLQISVECPPFRDLTADEKAEQMQRLQNSGASILFVAFGQPKGEYWMAENLAATGIPVAVQIGGTFDFMSGRIARAPQWMQKIGMEWAFRWSQEPRRLAGRYTSNIFFLLKMLTTGPSKR
jgi:N-acetylglucosaminyldiphosphoundecaprenol N-acetyl-beta-D-mannosaminyltransferase